MKGVWFEGVISCDDDIVSILRAIERENGKEFSGMVFNDCIRAVKKNDWGEIREVVWFWGRACVVRFRLLWLREGDVKRWKAFVRKDLNMERRIWFEHKIRAYDFAGAHDRVAWQRVMYAFKREEFERDYLGMLREYGLQVPDGDDVVAVLDFDEKLKVAVVETLGGEKYLCTKSLCVYVNDDYAVKIDEVLSISFGLCRQYSSSEELERELLQRVMSEVFGGGDE